MTRIDHGEAASPTADTSTALRMALDRSARAMLASPRALVFLAAMAGATVAHAQFAGDYERAGQSIGYDLGRAVPGGPAQGVASTLAQLFGSQMGRSMDQQRREQQQAAQQAQQQAMSAAQAAQAEAACMAAYDAQRTKADPRYVPGSQGYPVVCQRAGQATNQWASNGQALGAVDNQLAALQREWQMRNAHALKASAPQQTQSGFYYPRGQ